MPQVCVTSAMMACTFGAAPSSLIVTPSAIVTATLQVGTIMNFTPMANIPSFGTCMSIANPTVAAATAAADGGSDPHALHSDDRLTLDHRKHRGVYRRYADTG